MGQVRKYQNSFTTGVITPGAYARVDLAKYAAGCKRIVNGIVHPHGGVSKRPGTRRIASLPGPGLLFPFTYSVTQAYVLAFYNPTPANPSATAKMRVYRNGEFVNTAGDADGTGTPYEINTPYKYSDLAKLRFIQSADVMFFVHPSYSPRQLMRYGHADWKFQKMEFMPSIGAPVGLAVQATGFVDPTGTYLPTTIDYKVSAVDDRGRESIPSLAATAETLSTWPQGARVSLTWEAVSGADHYEIYKNARGYYVWIGSADENHFTDDNIEGDSTIGPKENRDPFNPPDTPAAPIVTIAGSTATPAAGSYEVIATSISVSGVESLPSIATTHGAASVSDLLFQAAPTANSETCRFYWQDPAREAAWYYQDATRQPVPSLTGISAVGNRDGVWHTYEATIETLSGSAPYIRSTAATPLTCQLKFGKLPTSRWDEDAKIKVYWADQSDAVVNLHGYRVYLRETTPNASEWKKLDVDISGSTVTVTGTTITRTIFEAMPSVTGADAPKVDSDLVDLLPGDGSGALRGDPPTKIESYPGAVGLIQQRLVFGRTNAEPNTVWMSETGAYDSFAVANPVRDDSAITVSVDSRQMNEIRHFVPLRDMLVFTGGAEFLLSAGRNSDAITPTSVSFRLQSYWGCSDVPPIVSGNAVLFAESSGHAVRDLRYRLEDDGYSGDNLSVLADHLLSSPIVDWAYQQYPYNAAWICLADGRLLTFTYLREQEVFAWTEHESEGNFLSVSVIREGGEDQAYFLTARYGAYYVEYQERRDYGDAEAEAWFVDCGKVETPNGNHLVTGLPWPDGTEVAVLADGSPVRGLKVLGGTVTLGGTLWKAKDISQVLVGLPYTMLVETLDPEIKLQEGTSTGLKRNVPQVVFQLRESLGLKVGPTESMMTEAKFPIVPKDGDNPALFSGTLTVTIPGSHREEASIVFVNDDPLPLTVLSVTTVVNLG